MPEYAGKIENGRMSFTTPDLINKWAGKHNNQWFRGKFEIIGESVDPKTREQLGFYWGLLVDEITKELNQQGHTTHIKFNGLVREIPYVTDTTHEMLTALCGNVGKDGASLRLSEMNLVQTLKFIDNVIEFAVAYLGMNEERLKAWK
jgi:hypothetical protein